MFPFLAKFFWFDHKCASFMSLTLRMTICKCYFLFVFLTIALFCFYLQAPVYELVAILIRVSIFFSDNLPTVMLCIYFSWVLFYPWAWKCLLTKCRFVFLLLWISRTTRPLIGCFLTFLIIFITLKISWLSFQVLLSYIVKNNIY